MPRAEGAITFDAVSFAYGRKKGGLDRIDLAIDAGERIGIVGASGAGGNPRSSPCSYGSTIPRREAC